MNFPDFPVLVHTRIAQAPLDQLAANFPLVRLWEAGDREAALTAAQPTIRGMIDAGRVDEAYLRRFPRLEIISHVGVGYDTIDVEAAARLGIIVTHTPSVLDEEVADTAMGLVLSTVRRLPQAERYLRSGLWEKGPFPLSPTLRGRTLGIVGLGRIGKAIARRAEAFGLKIAYHGRQPQSGVDYPYYPTALALAQACDILLLAAPGGPETHNIVDRRILEALGPEGVLINIARGSLVDEPALIEALQKGTILAAGLDVFVDEPRVAPAFIALDNVVLLPHVGSASVYTRQAMAQLVVDNLISFASGKGPLTPVKETPWPAVTKRAP
jgi:lactate dehydrogenase-like 2-hydroxyacid dehydrogenase